MSRSGQAVETLFGLNSRLKWMAACVSATIALTIPLVFFFTVYRFESDKLELAAERVADTISEFAYAQPVFWQYSDETLGEFLRLVKIGRGKSVHQLLGLNGEIIIEQGDYPNFPRLVRRADVVEGQNVVAHIRIAESLRPVLGDTMWVALFGFVLAALAFVVLRHLPMQASEATRRRLERQKEELEAAAKDLAAAKNAAEIANRAKSEFLANMSHELRTPLNAVLGFSEIIKDETLGPVGNVRYRGYANDINESARHLLGLINDILDLSKIESGTAELHEDEIEIPDIIHTTLKLVGHRAHQGGLNLESELPDQLPTLRADERKLKQILVNLLSNAVKFTDAGGVVTLRVWCRMGAEFVFQIADTGIGIAPEDIPKALSIFGQIDGALNRHYEGTGLGLPLTKALVELHGGTLHLQSKVSVGTTVTVRFPANRIVASQDKSELLDVGVRAAS